MGTINFASTSHKVRNTRVVGDDPNCARSHSTHKFQSSFINLFIIKSEEFLSHYNDYLGHINYVDYWA